MKELYRARTVVDLQDALGVSISKYDEAISVKDYICLLYTSDAADE